MNMISRPRKKLVVIGNGMAGMRTVEELLKRAPDCYDITVFGAEPHVNYNRIMLSSVLAGDKSLAEIEINAREWYETNGIRLLAGDPVIAIDRAARIVTSLSGLVEPYHRLLLAVGSRPIAPPIPGLELPGVHAFRDIADVEAMIEASGKHHRAAVIGGGLLGLEAANGLAQRGMAVAVVHLCDTLMERQLDPTAGRMLQKELDERGIAFFTNGQTEEITGTERVEGLILADGREIPADLVVLAIGIRPNIDLAKKAGLAVNRGIMVGDDMRSSDPNIYAVGECVEHRGQAYGLVAPLWEMAKVCAERLADSGADAEYHGSVVSTRLKVTGIDVFSAGEIGGGGEECETLTLHDDSRRIYKKLVLRDNRIEGIVLYGNVTDASWYFDLMQRKEDISAFREAALFGQAFVAHTGSTIASNIMDLPDTAEICGCNGVCKGDVLGAIANKGLTTLAEVRAHTKASASCGSCTPKVEQLLAGALGGDYAAPAVTPLCGCTDLGHDELRRLIHERGLKTIPETLHALDWRTKTGCHSCRPALNYYLLCAWPGEYIDDPRSRFINERVHANIQKDGTYSVVPRMWGGLTTPNELRAIADAADKHKVAMVKVTGGQRIDLFGLKKEQLPAIWADLNAAGMVSGHAYAKGLRTVKTCVGLEWCRFGTQDSTAMGVALERMCWGSWTPAKFKMAVSGCPRNCAEATIKDLGVIAVDSGWELYVAGNGGIKLRGADLMCKVATAEEVLEHAGALMQLYREEARYLERTAHWVERVGLAYVVARIADDAEGRKALHERFLYSQRFAQIDPWRERAEGLESQEFRAMAEIG